MKVKNLAFVFLTLAPFCPAQGEEAEFGGALGTAGGVSANGSYRSFISVGGVYGYPVTFNASHAQVTGLVRAAIVPSVDPAKADADNDGMPDAWEHTHGLDVLTDDASIDGDSDGLDNLDEYQQGSDPTRADTDADGLSDGLEVLTYHTNPTLADSDGDGYSDFSEVGAGTDPKEGSSNPGIPPQPVAMSNLFRRFNTAGRWGPTVTGKKSFSSVGPPL